MVFNTEPYTVLPDNSILNTANMQSETGFPSSHQLKSYVASKSRLKMAARAVLSADAGLLVRVLDKCPDPEARIPLLVKTREFSSNSLQAKSQCHKSPISIELRLATDRQYCAIAYSSLVQRRAVKCLRAYKQFNARLVNLTDTMSW